MNTSSPFEHTPTFNEILAERYVLRINSVVADDQLVRVDFARLAISVFLVPRAMDEFAIDARAGRVLEIVTKTDLLRRHFAHWEEEINRGRMNK